MIIERDVKAMDISSIVELKKKRLAMEMDFVSTAEMKEIAQGIKRQTISLRDALSTEKIAFIPEIKRISDSEKVKIEMYEPEVIAQELERKCSVKAVFVQTERDVYKGSAGHIRAIRKNTGMPIIRRDYIISPYQMYETKVIGADAVLIIAGLFGSEYLTKIINLGKSLGLECVVEVHDRHEIEKALAAGADIINIYNKEIRSIEDDIEKVGSYMEMIPKNTLVFMESGISNATEVAAAYEAGIKGIVLGDSFMATDDYSRTMSWLTSELR